ncbi:MAG TPA: chemotaxis protein CheX [Ruminiclostridium sp.]
MEEEKFNTFVNCVSDAFRNVADMVAQFEFKECSKERIEEKKKYSVVVGIVGKNKGRILFEAGGSLVKKLTEAMNDGPISNVMDVYICLLEFSNMFCGNAATLINNKYRGSDMRLTPPAVFSGVELQVITPNIHSITTYYKSEHGIVTVDIGFEGV